MKESVCYLTIYKNNIYEARRVFKRHGLPILCVCLEEISAMDQTVRKLCSEGIQVFIARGGVASVLKRATDVPVVSLPYDFMDFYLAVQKAFRLSDRVAMVGWYQHLNWFSEYMKLFPDKLKYYELPHYMEPDYKELVSVVHCCKEDGCEVIVGGAGVVPEAIKAGMKAVMIDINDASYLAAAEEALREARIQNEQALRFSQTTAILQNVNEGIVYTDETGGILQTNNRACTLFPALRTCRFLEDAVPDRELCSRLKNGEAIDNYILTVQDRRLVLNVSYIKEHMENIGILLSFQEASHIEQTEKSLRQDIVKKGLVARHTFRDIIGNSQAIQKARETASLYARSSGTVLISGETGSGKELFAQSIHNASARRQEPFVAVNCASLPESILESELFGYVKGAFTGARNEGKAGIFETANKGTIFLDEIGEISPKLQARLLRVIQEKEIVRVGDTKVIPVDVRIITATNRNLMEEVRNKNFREDLYYRLCVLVLELPPLRFRKEDIIPIADHLLWKIYHIRYKWRAEDITLVTSYQWPGNVRELSNFVERLMALCPDGESLSTRLAYALHPVLEASRAPDSTSVSNPTVFEDSRPENELLRALMECKGNRGQAAAKLGISRSTLWRRLRELEAAGHWPPCGI